MATSPGDSDEDMSSSAGLACSSASGSEHCQGRSVLLDDECGSGELAASDSGNDAVCEATFDSHQPQQRSMSCSSAGSGLAASDGSSTACRDEDMSRDEGGVQDGACVVDGERLLPAFAVLYHAVAALNEIHSMVKLRQSLLGEPLSVTTHFSGMGAAEVSCNMLTAATSTLLASCASQSVIRTVEKDCTCSCLCRPACCVT